MTVSSGKFRILVISKRELQEFRRSCMDVSQCGRERTALGGAGTWPGP